MSSSTDTQIIPDVIIDTNSKVSYTKGRYFGKVNLFFSKCQILYFINLFFTLHSNLFLYGIYCVPRSTCKYKI